MSSAVSGTTSDSQMLRKTRNFESNLALHCNEAPLNVKLEYMEILATSNTSTNRRQISNTDSLTGIDSRRI
ncbi:hypothetical protein RclHR1_00610010 [Rhizophagus clarus]|uniref:Uncharacterized protein n=1 Tax=Rhizophagus clarus TaxID=94130 RepID=A0A2Z6RQ77_9GLOM|nr:hypothetical protein RclHR1_00610010 [Rhizophagus clarus]GES75966.1 hypothetical protein GLOIN_2v211741 [Rhizophagus clarus]